MGMPYDTAILLIAPDPAVVESAVRSLILVGLDQVQGSLKSGIEAWEQTGNSLKETPQITQRIYTRRSRRLQAPRARCAQRHRMD
jgi:hypothetical protein